MSRFDRKDPAESEEYCNGLGRLRSEPDEDEMVTCAYCGDEMEPNPIRSSHSMCCACAVEHLAGLRDEVTR